MSRCTCQACRLHDAVAAAEERHATLLALEELAQRPSRRGAPVAQAALARHVTVREAERRGVWGWLRRSPK